MKLVRLSGLIVVLGALSACAGAPRTTASAPVTVTAAEWNDSAPRVGKAQRSVAQEESTKEPRRLDRRPGGGFSGWK
jgi:hypothetical protein